MIFISNFFNYIFLKLCSLLSFGKQKKLNESNQMLFINVAYNLKQHKGNLRLCLSKESSILDAKEMIVNKINFNLSKRKPHNFDKFKSDQVAIIFAGQELSDLDIIAKYELCQNSFINVVSITEKLSFYNENKVNLAESAVLLSTNEEILFDEQDENVDGFVYLKNITEKTNLTKEKFLNLSNLISVPKGSYFFVYCPDKNCKKITLGKLRVKCFKCKNNTLIVDKGPQCWNDVLIKDQIKGKCQSENCNGEWAEFYFKCFSNEHFDKNLNENVLPLQQIKHNTRQTKCMVCDDMKETVFVFKCCHVVCIECFTDYCKSKLNTRDLILVKDIGYTLDCLFGCENSWIEDIHYFHVLSDKDYEKYHLFATEEFIFQNGGTICPNHDCSQGMLIDEDKNSNKITCLSCKFVFCLKCKNAFHEGNCIENVYIKSTQDLNPELNKFSIQTIKSKAIDLFRWTAFDNDENKILLTKSCPNCKTPTERDGGCMHIICSRAHCKLNWCWICEKDWNNDCMANHWFN